MAQLSKQDLFTRKTSVLLNIAEDIVDRVVKFQFQQARENAYTSNDLELTGLGTFSANDFRMNRLLTRYKKIEELLQDKLETTKEGELLYESTVKKLFSLAQDIHSLENKLNDKVIRDMGGLQELPTAPAGVEGTLK